MRLPHRRAPPRLNPPPRVISRCLDPVWRQSFAFPFTRRERALEVRVWDHDQLSSSDFLGQVLVPLLPLAHQPVRQWFPLAKRSRKSNISGAILLELRCTVAR